MKVTNQFVKLWVLQMLENTGFLNDPRVTNNLVGNASAGDIQQLKALLHIYCDHVNLPSKAGGAQIIDYKQCIEEVIRMISAGNFVIE